VDIIIDSVNKLKNLLEHSGCEDGGITLDIDPNERHCQFENGACMTASFGGRSAVFVTSNPIRANTRISFMFGAPLDTPATRSAASAIINVITGFFCMSRVLHACPVSAHALCKKQLTTEISGRRVYCAGIIPSVNAIPAVQIVSKPQDADVILFGADGIISPNITGIITNFKSSKQIICLGPSTSGISRLEEIEHWCPFGTTQRDTEI
jgi:hypothetical protein